MRTYESLEVKTNSERAFLRGYQIRMDTKKSRNADVSVIISFRRQLTFVEHVRRTEYFLNSIIIEERPLVMLKNNDSFFIEVWYDNLELYL